MHIVDHTLSPVKLLSRTQVTYLGLLCSLSCQNKSNPLPVIESLNVDTSSAKNSCILSVDGSAMYGLESDEEDQMSEAVNYFIKSPTKNSTFHLA